MTSERKIFANRLNAKKSTGPKTDKGKHYSRQNAWRHGLTAETVISVIENPAEYEAFQAQFVADNQPKTALERELIARLASLLWRLRRATAIESALLQIQAKISRDRRVKNNSIDTSANQLSVFYKLIPSLDPPIDPDQGQELVIEYLDLARSFLRISNFGNEAFERLGRYETRLYRQLAQTLFLIGQIEKSNREPFFIGGELLGFARKR
jgi:hypothetical protein